MSRDHVEDALDLRKADLDPEFFADAIAVRHIRILIAHGGSDSGRPDDETALHPQHLEAFLSRAVSEAQKSKKFEHDWRRLQQAFPHVTLRQRMNPHGFFCLSSVRDGLSSGAWLRLGAHRSGGGKARKQCLHSGVVFPGRCQARWCSHAFPKGMNGP